MRRMPSKPEHATRSQRDALVAELSELTLPLMWGLRQAAMRAFEPLGLRPVKALLLTLIVDAPRYPKELSELLDTVPSVISTLLADLEERGLIERVPDADDRRRTRLRATDAGVDMNRRIADAWHRSALAQASALSDEDLAALIRVHRRLVDATRE